MKDPSLFATAQGWTQKEKSSCFGLRPEWTLARQPPFLRRMEGPWKHPIAPPRPLRLFRLLYRLLYTLYTKYNLLLVLANYNYCCTVYSILDAEVILHIPIPFSSIPCFTCEPSIGPTLVYSQMVAQSSRRGRARRWPQAVGGNVGRKTRHTCDLSTRGS